MQSNDTSGCFFCGPLAEEEQEHNNLTRRQVLTHGLFTGGTLVMVLWKNP
jgi:hypothetical protein